MTTEPRSQASQRGSIPVDSFANRLMLARAHAGHLSIREAAELCELGRGAWTNWEKGALPGDIIDIATVVADKLGVDREWLLFGGQLGQQEGGTRRGRRTRDNFRLHKLIPSDGAAGRSSAPPNPLSGGRRDATRPSSAIPATRRRPSPVRPPGHPKSH